MKALTNYTTSRETVLFARHSIAQMGHSWRRDTSDQPDSRRKMRDFTGCFENMPNFTENSRKEFQKFTENSRASQTLFRGAMLMQTNKSVE